MKKVACFFIYLVLVVTSKVFSQNPPIDPDTKLITWQGVVEEKGDAKTLYNRCIEWINKEYKNPQQATKVRDDVNGKIVIKYTIKLYDKQKDGSKIQSNTMVDYYLKLDFKDNKYRYTFTDFTMQATSKYPLERWLDKNSPSYQPKYADYLVQVEEEVNRLINSLKEGMKEKKVKQDNW